jgi:predicted HicB family RNase H-like nuclease
MGGSAYYRRKNPRAAAVIVNVRIRILDDIHREAKVAAVTDGISLKEYVIRALGEKLDRDEKKRAAK